MLGLLFFLAYLAAGWQLVRCLIPGKAFSVRVWLSACAGVMLMMWLPALTAFVTSFSLLGHALSLIPLALLCLLAQRFKSKAAPRPRDQEDKRTAVQLLCLALPMTLLSMYLIWTHDLRPAADGSLYTGQATYGDLSLHLSIITSLRGARFPADYAIFPGEVLSYPFLTDSFTASFMLGGLSLRGALLFSSFVMLALVFSGYVFLLRRICEKKNAVWLAFLLFFVNGGLGFVYLLDMRGVSLSYYNDYGELRNQLQGLTGLGARLRNVLQGWYQTPANHAEFDTYNLRWSNVIADMLIPQRTTMGGWSMLLPCLWLLCDLAGGTLPGILPGSPEKAGADGRQAVLLGVMAGGLPMVHTHSFVALFFVSLGFLLYAVPRYVKNHTFSFVRHWLLYAGCVCVLAVPQLVVWTFRQAFSAPESSGSFLSFTFNWVNNDGAGGLKDGYFWFYLKNIGLPYLLLLLSLLEKKPGRRLLACGAFTVYLFAELIRFQPNIYDNNKLFYVWYMLMCAPAADFALGLFEKLKGLRARWVLAVLSLFVFFCSGSLSIARECVSNYQLYGPDEAQAARYVEENTDPHAVFMTWTEHLNPVSSLAGRTIVCGPDLWLYWHGFDTAARQAEIRAFYEDPENGRDILEKYGVSYIMVGPYERADLTIDREALDALFESVFISANRSIQIYRVTPGPEVPYE